MLQIDFEILHCIEDLSHCSKYISEYNGPPSPPFGIRKSIWSTGIFHIKHAHLLVSVSLHIAIRRQE